MKKKSKKVKKTEKLYIAIGRDDHGAGSVVRGESSTSAKDARNDAVSNCYDDGDFVLLTVLEIDLPLPKKPAAAPAIVTQKVTVK